MRGFALVASGCITMRESARRVPPQYVDCSRDRPRAQCPQPSEAPGCEDVLLNAVLAARPDAKQGVGACAAASVDAFSRCRSRRRAVTGS